MPCCYQLKSVDHCHLIRVQKVDISKHACASYLGWKTSGSLFELGCPHFLTQTHVSFQKNYFLLSKLFKPKVSRVSKHYGVNTFIYICNLAHLPVCIDLKINTALNSWDLNLQQNCIDFETWRTMYIVFWTYGPYKFKFSRNMSTMYIKLNPPSRVTLLSRWRWGLTASNTDNH